jgi:hypothetical protein
MTMHDLHMWQGYDAWLIEKRLEHAEERRDINVGPTMGGFD